MECLIEIKKEYILLIVNIFTPLIYDGLMSIYDKAKNISDNKRILKIFQGFLKDIPKWNSQIIINETNRILINSECSDWLLNLVKATLKINLIIMSFPLNDIDKNDYDIINLNKFIHNIYIESARKIWNNPYLFYHNYPSIEIKRNQRDIIALINNAIKTVIRKLLPIKKLVTQCINYNFEKTHNNHFIKKNYKYNSIQSDKNNIHNQHIENSNENNLSIRETNLKTLPVIDNKLKNNLITNNVPLCDTNDKIKNKLITNNAPTANTSSNQNNYKTKSINTNSNILNIIEEQKIPLSTVGTIKQNIIKNNNESHASYNSELNIQLSATSSSNKMSDKIDSKIYNILKNDLDNNSSVTLTDKQFEDIYSNSPSKESLKNTDKHKFFSNYLKV